MNETKILRIGYLTICTLIALILPHITAEEDIPVIAQLLFQFCFMSMGLLVYIKVGDGR